MSFTRVCTPIDVHELSMPAIREARHLADLLRIPVEALGVTTKQDAEEVSRALEALVSGLDPPLAWRFVVNEDDDVEGALVQEILTDPKALWCLASHGRTALGELLLGSISADVVRDSGVPVVLVGPACETRPAANVLAVALDGHAASEAILPIARELGEALGYRLRLLQVGARRGPNDSVDQGYLIQTARSLKDSRDVDFDVLYGDPDEALVDYLASASEVAMIAMATRGIPAGARLSISSTSLNVLRHSEVPMLLLHQAQ